MKISNAGWVFHCNDNENIRKMQINTEYFMAPWHSLTDSRDQLYVLTFISWLRKNGFRPIWKENVLITIDASFQKRKLSKNGNSNP